MAQVCAHLDRWEIDGSTRVRAGDVIGYVGNTGNARTTPPHLHFGLYDDGAIDPTPFLRPDDPAPPPPGVNDERLGSLARVREARVPMRAGTMRAAPVRRHLERSTVVRLIGASRRLYRVVLPDRSEGYVEASAIARTDTPVRRTRAGAGAALLEAPQRGAPVVGYPRAGSTLDVLGQFGPFDFVRDVERRSGWMETRE